MESGENLPLITALGGDSRSGAYILRIRAGETLDLAFGRFRQGKVIHVPAGEYVYVGSAGGRGSTSLASRLVRHATRSGGKAAHRIRTPLIEFLRARGLGKGGLVPKNGKKLFWHVDHLLDQDSVEITAVIILRSTVGLEAALGKLLEHDPGTVVLEKGLGANDVPGNTHLLRVEAEETWRRLEEVIKATMRRLPKSPATLSALLRKSSQDRAKGELS